MRQIRWVYLTPGSTSAKTNKYHLNLGLDNLTKKESLIVLIARSLSREDAFLNYIC